MKTHVNAVLQARQQDNHAKLREPNAKIHEKTHFFTTTKVTQYQITASLRLIHHSDGDPSIHQMEAEWYKSFKRQRPRRSPRCHHGPSCAPNTNIVHYCLQQMNSWASLGFGEDALKNKRETAGSWDVTVRHCGSTHRQMIVRRCCLIICTVRHHSKWAVMRSVVISLHHSLCFYASNVSTHKLAHALQLRKANLSQHNTTERNATNLQEQTKAGSRTIFLWAPGLSYE